MKTTKSCNLYLSTPAVSALVLSLLLTACGQGFHTRHSQTVASNFSDSYLTNDFINEVNVPDDSNGERSPAAVTTPPELQDNTQEQYALGMKPVTLTPDAQQQVLMRFKNVDPQHQIATNLLKQALLFYFVNGQKFPNTKVITIIDYALPSSQKRLFVVEISTGRVWSTYVAHGSGSDRNHDGEAEGFSNRVNSNATSLGPFMTMTPYEGGHGYSLRLKGLGKYNSNAYARNVVVHGAQYVHDQSVQQGRSWGCIAVAPQYSRKLISTVKGGSLIYAGVSNPARDHEF